MCVSCRFGKTSNDGDHKIGAIKENIKCFVKNECVSETQLLWLSNNITIIYEQLSKRIRDQLNQGTFLDRGQWRYQRFKKHLLLFF